MYANWALAMYNSVELLSGPSLAIEGLLSGSSLFF